MSNRRIRPAVLALVGMLALIRPGRAEEGIRLREAFPINYQYHVSCRVNVTGSLSVPAQGQTPASKLDITGTSVIEYDERILALSKEAQVEKTLRFSKKMDFQRKVGNQTQESSLRPTVRRMVIMRLKNSEVPFSPDGPLTWGEIELVRVDVFTPALIGLLPEQTVRPGDRWTATNAAVEELTDMEKVEEGKIECKLDEVTTVNNRRYARVSLSGTVRGVNEDGPNKQQLDGYFYFDLESNHLSYLSFKGVHILMDRDGKEAGRVEGQFTLSRQAHTRSPELADDSLKAVKLEPDAENTLLLYENPDLGVKLLYPRRWRVGGVRGKQLTLDEPGGNGVLLTIEPVNKIPTAAAYEAEARAFFTKEKANVVKAEPPQKLQAAPQEVERFSLDVDLPKMPATMDYYLLRQEKAGATAAARLVPKDLTATRAEVEKIMRSVTLTGEGK